MNFATTSEEKALVDALRQILNKACPTERLRAWESQGISFDREFGNALAEGGFLEAGLAFGSCPSFTALTLLEEEAGRFLAPPLLSWLSGYAAYLLGERDLTRKVVEGSLVSPIIPGSGTFTLDAETLAGQGRLQFLDRADLIFGLASQGSGTSAFWIQKDAPRIELREAKLQSGSPSWDVTVLGARPMGLVPVAAERVQEALNRLRTCLATWSVGAAARAIDLAVAYACERRQFDHPIGSYQSVQNRLVDAAIQVEEARMLTYRAAALIEGGAMPEAVDLACLARHLAGQAFTQASRAAMMTFGGYGFTVDFDAQLYFRRAKENQLTFEPRTLWEDGAAVVPGFRDPETLGGAFAHPAQRPRTQDEISPFALKTQDDGTAKPSPAAAGEGRVRVPQGPGSENSRHQASPAASEARTVMAGRDAGSAGPRERANNAATPEIDFAFTAEQEEFRREIRKFCQQEITAKSRNRPSVGEQHDPDFYRLLAERGYIGMQWPREHGGQARSHVDMAIFYEEMAYANAPLGRYTGSVVFVGESLITYASEEQRLEYLPRIARGEITCCWCLSEPEAGSDAAAQKTKAEQLPDGGFRLTGQKIFTSGAHIADFGLVAARTSSTGAKHQGISLFLVPMRDPAITIQPLWTIGGWRVNQVFFDGVVLPARALVGKRDQGWSQIRLTLNFERSAIGNVGLLMRIFDKIQAYTAENDVPVALRGQLVRLRAEIEAQRWISYRVAWLQDQGEVPDALASMSKLRTSEITVSLSELGMEILGYRGVERGAEAPLRGEVEDLYRNTSFFLMGGGTPDIQRMVIAQRGLGLPR